MSAVTETSPAAERRLWHRLGCQLAHPEGTTGRVMGHLMARLNREPNRHAIKALRLEPDDDVLEVGFGPGEALVQIARRVTRGRICGLDGSPTMLEQAGHRNARMIDAGRMELRCGDMRRLPWADASFSKLLAVNVAYFFDPEGLAAAELHRVLRPGGLLALYVTERATMAHWPFAGPDTHTTYDGADLERVLRASGFRAQNLQVRPLALPFGIAGLVVTAAA
ncbi:class I SAM-dependent methyltransferase [Xanthobacter sp. NM-25]|uniref:class I SAM-dependent methyltransferase n=1 Tax=unclassified Xanthobacter TaxID=2623496 RepID=UPI003FD25B99